jgi:hypothetical protein
VTGTDQNPSEESEGEKNSCQSLLRRLGGKNSDYIPAPEGTFSAVCCDVVDLGMLEVTFGGKTKEQHKIWIVWQIEEVMADNRPYTVRKRYTLSLHEKASLRKDLESWRGRAFTASELEGFDVETVLGVACMLNVIHAAGSQGGEITCG